MGLIYILGCIIKKLGIFLGITIFILQIFTIIDFFLIRNEIEFTY
jgi:hypothetical protein